MSRVTDRRDMEVETRQTLAEADLDMIETQLLGIKKGIWVLVGIVGSGVAGFFFQLLADLSRGAGS